MFEREQKQVQYEDEVEKGICPEACRNTEKTDLAIDAEIKCRERNRPKACRGITQIDRENDSVLKTLMKMYAERIEIHQYAIKEQHGALSNRLREEERRFTPNLPCLKTIASITSLPMGFEYNTFNMRKCWYGGLPSALMWQCWRDFRTKKDELDEKIEIPCRSDSFNWPNLWPCSKRDPVKEKKVHQRKMRMKKIGALPCEVEAIESPESSEDEEMKDLACLKELGHARIPPTLSRKDAIMLVDRDVGERPGLVEGECYATYGLSSSKCCRSIATVTLRGLTGMHMSELVRSRDESWKFCMFQGLVALLVKTQLRYKFAWNANIDYIYNHAWNLFIHMGYLKTKRNQRFDDVLVYNYKYNVELELVQELENTPAVSGSSFKFFEKAMDYQSMRNRRELTVMKSDFGSERLEKDCFSLMVHHYTKCIERWFNKLDEQFTNCIFKVSRFSLAFWQDGSFWYLYNPYRCDKFGFWHDGGYASITKFCSKAALRRHLMILIIRAYSYVLREKSEEEKAAEARYLACLRASGYDIPEQVEKREKFTCQIYQLIYHSCHIHNVKLLLRIPRQPKPQMVEKPKCDSCTYDPLTQLSPLNCEQTVEFREKEKLEELEDKMERPRWILQKKITWVKDAEEDKSLCKEVKDENKWHNFLVVEPRRIFVLWGELHICDRAFLSENRGNQFLTCYAVCAGMSLVNAPEYWTHHVINAIIVAGDKFYSERRIKLNKSKFSPLNELDDDWDQRPADNFKIGEMVFDMVALPGITGRLYLHNHECLWRTLERFFQRHRFGILACESVRLGLFKHCGAYYAFDARTYGPPIFETGSGMAYLLRTSCFLDLITCIILLIGSSECSNFVLRAIEIVGIKDNGGGVCGKRKCPMPKSCGDEDGRKGKCPYEEDKKRGKKKGRKSAAERLQDEKENAPKVVCLEQAECECK